MKRRPQQFSASGGDAPADAKAVLQIKGWLIGISPMVWRRVLVPAAFALRNFLRPRSRHQQHVPADHRRLHFLRRTATVLGILKAA